MEFKEKLDSNKTPVATSRQYLGEMHQAKGKPGGKAKAEVHVKEEANGKHLVPGKSFNLYSWQEIQKHNQKTHQWLVINRKVYDVTSWAHRHPGGFKVLNHCAGGDATDAFKAMHFDLDVVQLYLKPLLIGELAPEEPSQERNKNVSEPSGPKDLWKDGDKIYFKAELVQDFRKLRSVLEAKNMFKANLGFCFLHLAQILILDALAWLIVWNFGNCWTITILISCLLCISQAQSSFLQHDLGHLSIFKKSKWNHLMHKFVACHLKGLSRSWWNYQHFQHHVKPNIYPKDPDIKIGPFFVIGDFQPVKYAQKKIKYINYEKQHLYFYIVLLPLFIPVYINLLTLRTMYRQRHWEELAWISSFYIRHFITFGPYYGIFGTVLLIYFVKLLESPWMACVTQMSHIPMTMSLEENWDWFTAQVLTTCNVEQSFFNDWFTGHLNFQIEHHLFPTMPRHNYHKVAPLVRSLCAKHGFQYVEKPLLKAFGDIGRALKRSGALWAKFYYAP